MPIGGGKGYPVTPRDRARWIADHARRLSAARVAELLDRYGTVAADVIAAIEADPADAALAAAPAYSTAELRHLARTEHVVHLDDLLMRRTSLAFVGAVTDAAAAAIAAAIAPAMGWDAATAAAEASRAVARVHAADPTWNGGATGRAKEADRAATDPIGR